MKMKTFQLLSFSVLLVVVYVKVGAGTQANGPDDVRWRLVSGLEGAYLYADEQVSKDLITNECIYSVECVG